MSQAVGGNGGYQYLTGYDSYNYNGDAVVNCIVVHHWGNDGQNFFGVIDSLCGSREASAHYVLQDNLVACLIPPGKRAWHVAGNEFNVVMPGVSDINANSIGIECRPECTDGDVDTLVRLIADLWMDYGKVPVYGHKEFMATQCPGRYQSKLDDIVARAEAIYFGDDVEVDGMKLTDEEVKWVKDMYANSKKTACSEWANEEFSEAVEAGITTGERAQDVAKREKVAIMVKRAVDAVVKKLSK